MITQIRSKRSDSGGRVKDRRKKRLYETGRKPIMTKVGKQHTREDNVKGGTNKQRVLQAEVVNVFNPKTKKYSKAAIKQVVDSPANRNYVRRNILTKGTVVETEAGKARITNRPGQEGSINAVLV